MTPLGAALFIMTFSACGGSTELTGGGSGPSAPPQDAASVPTSQALSGERAPSSGATAPDAAFGLAPDAGTLIDASQRPLLPDSDVPYDLGVYRNPSGVDAVVSVSATDPSTTSPPATALSGDQAILTSTAGGVAIEIRAGGTAAAELDALATALTDASLDAAHLQLPVEADEWTLVASRSTYAQHGWQLTSLAYEVGSHTVYIETAVTEPNANLDILSEATLSDQPIRVGDHPAILDPGFAGSPAAVSWQDEQLFVQVRGYAPTEQLIALGSQLVPLSEGDLTAAIATVQRAPRAGRQTTEFAIDGQHFAIYLTGDNQFVCPLDDPNSSCSPVDTLNTFASIVINDHWWIVAIPVDGIRTGLTTSPDLEWIELTATPPVEAIEVPADTDLVTVRLDAPPLSADIHRPEPSRTTPAD